MNEGDKESTETPGAMNTTVDISYSANDDEVEFRNTGNINRNRPYSASMISRKTASSTKSRASLNPHAIVTDFISNNLFSYRNGVLDGAVDQCRQMVLKEDLDGSFKGAWLLTEIDHWDLEKEKLVVLTEKALYLMKFDFIKLVITDIRRIVLTDVFSLQIGDFVYPHNSLMYSREHGGVRIHFSRNEMSLIQRWNPWTKQAPCVTLSHHMLIYNKHETETATFNVDDFYESLLQEITRCRQNEGLAADGFQAEETELLIESYASITSLVYNQSRIGFNMERGGVSF